MIKIKLELHAVGCTTIISTVLVLKKYSLIKMRVVTRLLSSAEDYRPFASGMVQ